MLPPLAAWPRVYAAPIRACSCSTPWRLIVSLHSKPSRSTRVRNVLTRPQPNGLPNGLPKNKPRYFMTASVVASSVVSSCDHLHQLRDIPQLRPHRRGLPLHPRQRVLPNRFRRLRRADIPERVCGGGAGRVVGPAGLERVGGREELKLDHRCGQPP